MKKTFKKAGVVVLSMAMLLSMGAMAMPASAQALPKDSKIVLSGAPGKYCVYQVASTTKDANGTVVYTINDGFSNVLKFDSDKYVKTVDGNKLLKDMNGVGEEDNSEIEKVAADLMKAAPITANKVVEIKNDETSVDIDLGGENGLGSGYYLILGTTSGKTQPILIDVVPSEGAVVRNVKAKSSEVPFIKAITKIDNPHSKDDQIGKDADGNEGGTGIAAIDGTVEYTLTTVFPNYDSDVKDIDPFTITDIPEDSIEIDMSTIKVKVKKAEISAAGNYTLTTENIKESTLSANYKEDNGDDFVTTVTTNGKGFQIAFEDAYVLANGGSAVEVTFDAKVTKDADLVGDDKTIDDTNDNGATLSYSNNYYTGKGSVKYGNPKKPGVDEPSPSEDETPDVPEENPQKPKVLADDAKVLCTLVTVDKYNTEDNKLPGATFALYEGESATGEPIARLGVQDKDSIDYVSTFVFNGLGAGKYTLHEVTAPEGYTKSGDVTFEIKADANNTTKVFDADSITFVNTTNGNNIKVVDFPKQTLPGTGGIGTYLFMIGGAAIIMLSGVLFVIYMKKRKEEEE